MDFNITGPRCYSAIFLTPVLANKWSFLVPSSTHNVPYIHPTHDLILELWQTFPNAVSDIYIWIDIGSLRAALE